LSSRDRKLLTAAALPAAILQAACLLLAVELAGSLIVGARLGPPRDIVGPERIVGLRILDRDGTLLREPLGAQGDRGRWVSLHELPPHLPRALLAAEDDRFLSHSGVDHLAVGRAMVQNAAAGRVVSGASTITQQLAKLTLHGAGHRTLGRKLLEMAASQHFERHLTKDEVLEAYVNWVPLGHLTRGCDMAARTYFHKPASHLTLSESAALAALLRGPGALDPYRHPDRLEQRRRWVLGRMAAEGFIDQADLRHALRTPPVFQPPSPVFRAPHLADEILSRTSRDRLAAGTVTTTIDLDLQRKAENLAARIVEGLGPLDVTNAAIVVIHNPTAEVLAWVGSAGYFDDEDGGMNDGVTARRSPGSALKPFVYAQGLESGHTPASLFEDVETFFPTPEGPYRPRNYDGMYHGPVLLRQALGSSYNVPAVTLAAHLGPDRVLASLREAGFDSLDEDGSHYGAAIALGDGEVTLLELAAAYSALARGGTWRQPVIVRSVTDAAGEPVALDEPARRRILGPQTAYLVTSILSDPAARAPAFGEARVFDPDYPLAVKTGTSHDYRDNWAVGYTAEVTVAVWVGNFDGQPMGNISGITGAGPLLREVVDLAMAGHDPAPFPRPSGLVERRVCSLSGALPGPACTHTHEEIFAKGTEPREACTFHVLAVVDGHAAVLESYPPGLQQWAVSAGRPLLSGGAEGAGAREASITSPRDGALFATSPDVPAHLQLVEVKMDVPPDAGSASLLVDGRKAGTVAGPPWILDWVLEPGEHRMAVTAGGLTSDPITVFVD
jgi:penicillin-binding protein 1C